LVEEEVNDVELAEKAEYSATIKFSFKKKLSQK